MKTHASTPLAATIEGIGYWTRGLPSWEAACAFARTGTLPDAPPTKPSPQLLPANERRRAPESVAVALEVAQAACTAAGRDPAVLSSIFASTDGDIPITDYMCSTLRDAPETVSPTKFHNSVHNAAAGYWTIGQHCMAPSTAISAFRATFAQGLLEALMQLMAGEPAVLLAAYDTAAVGPMTCVSDGTGLLGGALVLSAVGNEGLQLHATLCEGTPTPADGALGQHARGNRMVQMLPLFDALALGVDASVRLDAGVGRVLQVEVRHG